MNRLGYVAGGMFLVAGFLLTLGHGFVFDWVLPLAERFASPDAQIGPARQFDLSLGLFTLGLFSLLASAFFFASRKESFRRSLNHTFVQDPHLPSSPLLRPIDVLVISSVLGILLTVLYVLRDALSIRIFFEEDGVMEWLTFINLIVAAALMWATAPAVWKRGRYCVALSYVLIAAFFFFFAMEEISWGQRLFGWETPETYAALNQQQETNLHNLFENAVLDHTLQIAAVFFLLGLLGGWLVVRRWQPTYYHLVFPHASLVVLAGLIVFSGLVAENELLEELASFFALLYSLRVFTCFRSSDAPMGWQVAAEADTV